jgi:2-dehydropantoate 2-reductase
MRFGFIGAGSIGSLFGGYLSGAKSDIYSIEVIFFCLKDHAEVINKKGLALHRNQDIKVVNNIQAYENEKLIEEKMANDLSFKFDFIFLTTKAYDSRGAMLQYKKIIDASKYLVILQNGIGNEEIVINFCNKKKIIRAVTTNGALLDKPGQVLHTGEGITKIGYPFFEELNLELREFEEAKSLLIILKDFLNSVGLDTVIVEDIIKESWEKALINIGINAIAALTRLTNGELLNVEGLTFFIREVIEEAIRIAELKNIIVSKKDHVSRTYEVLKKTASNKNSMLQDILNRKATEIDFLNGRIVEDAVDFGIKVPYNELLTYLIKGLENSTD